MKGLGGFFLGIGFVWAIGVELRLEFLVIDGNNHGAPFNKKARHGNYDGRVGKCGNGGYRYRQACWKTWKAARFLVLPYAYDLLVFEVG